MSLKNESGSVRFVQKPKNEVTAAGFTSLQSYPLLPGLPGPPGDTTWNGRKEKPGNAQLAHANVQGESPRFLYKRLPQREDRR